VSEFESTERLLKKQVTVRDIEALRGAATPHFAQQTRERIKRLIKDLPLEDPVRSAGIDEISKLDELIKQGEHRGTKAQPGQRPLSSQRDRK